MSRNNFLIITVSSFISMLIFLSAAGCEKNGSSSYLSPASAEILTLPKDGPVNKDDLSDQPVTVPNMIYINPYAENVNLNQEFSLEVSVNNIPDLFAASFYLIYDPVILQFVSAKEGLFLAQDGNATIFAFFNDANHERIIAGLTRLGQVKGVSGSGIIMSINFKAVGIGKASIVFNKTSVKKATIENPAPQLFHVTFRGAQINVK